MDFLEVQLCWLLPVVPCTRYHHLFRSWNLVWLETKHMWLYWKSWRSFQNLFETLFNLPSSLPKLTFLKFKCFNFLFWWVFIFFRLDEWFNLSINLLPIDINFVLESIKLTVPASGNIGNFNNTFKSIFSQLLIKFFVFEAIDCSTHASFEVLNIIRHKIESISFFGFHIKLKNWILQASCSESNNRSAATKELMLNDSSWFE